MPRITQGNAKESLLATVTNFTEVTGEQVGLVFTWKGKIVVIGKEPFKELINEHRRDVQKSLFTFSSSAESNHLHPTPTPPEVDNSGIIGLLNSNIDSWSFSVERLRKLLNVAIRTSMCTYLYAINSPIFEVYKISSKGIILHSNLLLLRAYKYIMTYLVFISCADKEGKVSLFDSMFESVSDEAKLQLAEIYPQKHTFKYIMKQMQQQTGS